MSVMTRYEYSRQTIDLSLADMNKLGDKGWELVAVDPETDTTLGEGYKRNQASSYEPTQPE